VADNCSVNFPTLRSFAIDSSETTSSLQIGMAELNFTGDGQQKTLEYLLCSPDLTVGLHGHLISLSVLHSFLSVTTFLGNALILIALRKESSLHPPSKFLLRSLAATDLCVGIVAEPLVVTFLDVYGE